MLDYFSPFLLVSLEATLTPKPIYLTLLTFFIPFHLPYH